MDVLDVPCIDTNLDTVTFVRLGGATPDRLFFFGNSQRKQQTRFVPTYPKIERQLTRRVGIIKLVDVRQLIGFVKVSRPRRGILAREAKPIEKGF